MKYWKRWLGITLTIMTLALASPGALAANEITLKSGKEAPDYVYTGYSYTLKVHGQSKAKFYSSDSSIATIRLITGVFRPKAPGKVMITGVHASSGKKLASKTFTVLHRAADLTVTPNELNLAVNETHKLTATKTPKNSTDAVEFYSDNKKVASVSRTTGKVTAKKKGSATITVYSKARRNTGKNSKENITATVKVTVKEEPGLITDTKNKDDSKIAIQFSQGTPKDEMAQATFTIDGEIIDVSKISFNMKNNTATYVLGRKLEDGETCQVSFKGQAVLVKSDYTRCKELKVEPAQIKLAVGETISLAPSMTPADATDSIRYKSSAEKTATVDKNGLVTGKKPGETEILVYATKKPTTKLANKNNVVVSVPVVVQDVDAIAEAKQVAKKRVRMTFFRDTKGIPASAIEIVGRESEAKAKVAFKDAVSGVSNKNYILDLVLDEELTDGRRYAVVYTNQFGETSEAEFTAMDLVVAGYKILPECVAAGVPTRVKAWTVNKDGQRLYGKEGGLKLTLQGETQGVTFKDDYLTIDEAGKEAEIFAGVEEGGGDSAIITCVASGDKVHLFCAALYPEHELSDGKEHVPGDCRQPDHFKCDGVDHAAAICGIEGHFNCDDLDHEPAECNITGHWECKDEHGICPICFSRLCDGGEHGPGDCYPPTPVPPPTPVVTAVTINDGTRPDFGNIKHSFKKGTPNLYCFARIYNLTDPNLLNDYWLVSDSVDFEIDSSKKGTIDPNIIFYPITCDTAGVYSISVMAGADTIDTLIVTVTD